MVFSASLWHTSKALQAACDRWDMYLEKDRCHLCFPSVFLYTGKNHRFNSVNSCREKKEGVQDFSDLTRKLSQENRPNWELTFWTMMQLLETIDCPAYRDLISLYHLNAHITDRMLPEVFSFWFFPQSVIQVTGSNLQWDAGRTANLRNPCMIIVLV